MRPLLEGDYHSKVIAMVENTYIDLSPTELIKELIVKHYDSLYPSGKKDNKEDDNTSERKKSGL